MTAEEQEFLKTREEIRKTRMERDAALFLLKTARELYPELGLWKAVEEYADIKLNEGAITITFGRNDEE